MTFKSDFAAATAPLTPAAKTAAVARGAGLDQMGAAVQAKVQDLIFTLREYAKLHPPISRTLTVAGTAKAGDVLTLTFTPLGGSSTTASYTMTGADTLITGALGLANAINAASGVSTIVATFAGTAVLTISYNLVPSSISASVGGSSPTDTLTLAAPTGSTDVTNLTNICNALAELL
jgi:hypothetical protein